MKKKIIAGAVLGVLSGAVFAQSSVTIYGLIDAGVVVERNGVFNGGKTTSKLEGGVINGSRIGFKGVEDLGGGLSAIFTIESGFTADDGQNQQSALFGRQSFVGLTGGFGTVKAGRFYTVVDNVLGATDPFGNGLAGRSPNLVGVVGNADGGGYAARFNNLIQYSTANLSGFTADVQYGFGEVAGDASKGRNWGVALNYVNGPLTARLAHQRSNNAAFSSTSVVGGALISALTTALGTTPTAAQQAAILAHNAQHTILGATYDFGAAKLHGAYVRNKRSIVDTSIEAKSDDILVGVTVPFGAHKVFASFINKKDKSSDEVKFGNAQQYAVGYTYDLSKRTTVYAAYAAIKNKGDAVYTVGNATRAGSGTQALNLGLRHAF